MISAKLVQYVPIISVVDHRIIIILLSSVHRRSRFGVSLLVTDQFHLGYRIESISSGGNIEWEISFALVHYLLVHYPRHQHESIGCMKEEESFHNLEDYAYKREKGDSEER